MLCFPSSVNTSRINVTIFVLNKKKERKLLSYSVCFILSYFFFRPDWQSRRLQILCLISVVCVSILFSCVVIEVICYLFVLSVCFCPRCSTTDFSCHRIAFYDMKQFVKGFTHQGEQTMMESCAVNTHFI